MFTLPKIGQLSMQNVLNGTAPWYGPFAVVLDEATHDPSLAIQILVSSGRVSICFVYMQKQRFQRPLLENYSLQMAVHL